MANGEPMTPTVHVACSYHAEGTTALNNRE